MSELRILQIVHDHPAFTNGGTEWIAHDLTRALSRRGLDATLLAATTSLSRPDAPAGSLERHEGDLLLKTGRYDTFSMTRVDGASWVATLGRVLTEKKPDIVHLHGLDRIGADVVSFVRAHRPRARVVLTLHDMQLICAREGLMLTSEGALCHAASPSACRRCMPELSVARHALREARLKAALAGVDLFVSPSSSQGTVRGMGLACGSDRTGPERGAARRSDVATGTRRPLRVLRQHRRPQGSAHPARRRGASGAGRSAATSQPSWRLHMERGNRTGALCRGARARLAGGEASGTL